MPDHELNGGKLHVYKRVNSRILAVLDVHGRQAETFEDAALADER